MTTTSPWSPEQVRQVLEDLESSGLSVAEFARQQGVGAHRIYWARDRARASAKKRAASSGGEFARLAVTDRAVQQEAPIELQLPTGICIRVTRDFDDVALRRLLGVLAQC